MKAPAPLPLDVVAYLADFHVMVSLDLIPSLANGRAMAADIETILTRHGHFDAVNTLTRPRVTA